MKFHEGVDGESPPSDYWRAMMANITQEQRDASLATIPNTRFGKPDDIAAMAIHLLSEDGAWIQGQSISVDGGLTMRP